MIKELSEEEKTKAIDNVFETMKLMNKELPKDSIASILKLVELEEPLINFIKKTNEKEKERYVFSAVLNLLVLVDGKTVKNIFANIIEVFYSSKEIAKDMAASFELSNRIREEREE